MAKLKKSSRRQKTANGDWPVADPEPVVIDLLRQVTHINNSSVMSPDAVKQLISRAHIILGNWIDREDINELREALGLNLKQRRRRTQKTVNREYAIAFAYAEHQARGTRNPRQTVAEEFYVDERTVDRASEGWGHVVDKVVKIFRDGKSSDFWIDYSSMKK